MPVLRFSLGVVSLGTALYLGWSAYWCWAVRGILRACWGNGDRSEVLGLTMPYPLAMTLLVGLGLFCALGAIYVLFFPPKSGE